MLQRNRQSAGSAGTDDGASIGETIQNLQGIFRRQWPLVALICGTATFVGLLYLITTPARYTATATMVIDTRKVQLLQQQSVLGDAPIDSGMVQTEVEILKSQNVSLAVIHDLKLADDPEFNSTNPGLVGALLRSAGGLFVQNESLSDSIRERRVLTAFEAARNISRTGLTYVMNISFEARDPEKAARIANAIADAYITDQLEAKYQATRRASKWLQDRIAELRVQASDADRSVVEFKQSHNINTVDRQTGKLMTDQDVSEVGSQLVIAKAATAEAKARLDRISEVLRNPIPDASVADALKNEVIIKLRQQYLELAAREALWSRKYGSNHLAAVNLRTQMDELRRNVADEVQKIAASYKSDYEIALARENSVRSSLRASVSASQMNNKDQIQLRQLESTSQTYRSMYDNFLQRYMEAIQQQSFPITEARLISPAVRPIQKSSPKIPLVLTASFLGGLLLGVGAATAREMADRVFRSTAQVEERLNLPCLAVLPHVKGSKHVLASAETPREVERPLPSTAPMMRYVLDQPFSRFTEALRAVKVAADFGSAGKRSKILGFTSALPNEGKSTVSVNFAQLIAHAGSNTLLIDGDLRNPTLSQMLARDAKLGWLDVIFAGVRLEDVMFTDRISGLSFVPVGGGKLIHTSEILGSDRVRTFFEDLRRSFDYIIVDFAPLAPVVDTRTTSSFIDSYAFVIEWGKTKYDVVEHALADAPEIHGNVLGVIMNKANVKVIGRYERYRSNYYYRKYYHRYGYTA